MKTRQQAYELLTQYVTQQSLIQHCLAVEAAMRQYANIYGEDEETWAICGLLHDFDYEQYPSMEQHPYEGVKILKAQQYPEEVCTAIMGHGNHTGVPRTSLMAKTLFAVDELSGLIVALAKVRPGGFDGMNAKSVKKALKKKGFAATVSREDIAQGIRELGVDENEHYTRVIAGLQSIQEQLL